MDIQLLLELICSKKGGATKKEIKHILKLFLISDHEIKWLFNRIYHVRWRTETFSVILLNNDKKWYTFDNQEYCRIILRKLSEYSQKPVEKPVGIPFWIYEEHDLCFSVFSSSDYIYPYF